MINATISADGREFAVEVTGPFDLSNWQYMLVEMDLDEEAAFVGCGRTARGAIENAVRNTIGTPYEECRPDLERETQAFLKTFAGSDVEQGDGYMKLYCVLKVKK